MVEEIKTYLNVVLDGKETQNLEAGKDKAGIRSNSEFIRYLINAYAKDEK